MIKTSLWPVEIYQLSIDKDSCDLIKAQVVSYAAQDIPPEDMIKLGAFSLFCDLLSDLGNVTITDAWIRNAYPGQDDGFEIHCDSHKGSDYIGVFWMTGDEGYGGDIVIYDPAWRNPQHLRFERQQRYSLKHTFKFKLGEFILFPSYVWHEVTAYTGNEERISLNFAININGPNN